MTDTHAEGIDPIAAWAKADANIRAVVMTGSAARGAGQADRFSDRIRQPLLDSVLGVRPKPIPTIESGLTTAQDVGRLRSRTFVLFPSSSPDRTVTGAIPPLSMPAPGKGLLARCRPITCQP